MRKTGYLYEQTEKASFLKIAFDNATQAIAFLNEATKDWPGKPVHVDTWPDGTFIIHEKFNAKATLKVIHLELKQPEFAPNLDT